MKLGKDQRPWLYPYIHMWLTFCYDWFSLMSQLVIGSELRGGLGLGGRSCALFYVSLLFDSSRSSHFTLVCVRVCGLCLLWEEPACHVVLCQTLVL